MHPHSFNQYHQSRIHHEIRPVNHLSITVQASAKIPEQRIRLVQVTTRSSSPCKQRIPSGVCPGPDIRLRFSSLPLLAVAKGILGRVRALPALQIASAASQGRRDFQHEFLPVPGS
jgi:hypothetical protein